MIMPGRNFNADKYRFGFNGKEMDDEVKGVGNQYDYGFRIYDSRLSRFLSVDPLFSSYPWYTSYQFAGNAPIWAIDLDGLEQLIHVTYVDFNNKVTEWDEKIDGPKDNFDIISRSQVSGRYEDVKVGTAPMNRDGADPFTIDKLPIRPVPQIPVNATECQLRPSASLEPKLAVSANGTNNPDPIGSRKSGGAGPLVNVPETKKTKGTDNLNRQVTIDNSKWANEYNLDNGKLNDAFIEGISEAAKKLNSANVTSVIINITQVTGPSIQQEELRSRLETLLKSISKQLRSAGLKRNIEIKKGNLSTFPTNSDAKDIPGAGVTLIGSK
jgi:RHS repeat-associated protein